MSRLIEERPQDIGPGWRATLRAAAVDASPVSGLTHRFYRYPARFSPQFAGTAIELFSQPGDLVLDPYMGGGTTVVEAIARGRDAVGGDINSLAAFITRVKTTPLTTDGCAALRKWADEIVPALSYWSTPEDLANFICDRRAYNLTLPRARPIKKVIALALRTLAQLQGESVQQFARCALLNTAQLFLNGRRREPTPSLTIFRNRLRRSVHEMLEGLEEFCNSRHQEAACTLLNCSATDLPTQVPFTSGRKARLVVTSPPYPGIHMLYHRWQVDGRRETPAPYWMAGCQDGRGNAFYNFADRSAKAEETYFSESLRTLTAIRKVTADGATIVQLVAFSDPTRQLRRYLANMELASFREMRLSDSQRRLWRNVPSRRWHANSKGKLNASREVVLVHTAV
jgi:DNA modification methylase